MRKPLAIAAITVVAGTVATVLLVRKARALMLELVTEDHTDDRVPPGLLDQGLVGGKS